MRKEFSGCSTLIRVRYFQAFYVQRSLTQPEVEIMHFVHHIKVY